MARPLREQFAVAAFLLLIPVGAVMIWVAGLTYKAQLDQIEADAETLARAVADHIAVAGPEGDATLETYLQTFPLPPGGRILLADSQGRTVRAYERPSDDGPQELTFAGAGVPDRGWTVSVGLPTSIAWVRAGPNYRRIVAISGLATVILLVLQIVFLRQWLPALSHLEGSAARVGAGDLSTPPSQPMPTRELEHLRDALIDMVDKLRAAREAIAQQVEEERRMRHELQSLQQQLIRQERLAAIGVLLSGIAHELNNPLQAIAGFSELLQRDRTLTDQARADLALVQKESMRASGIIRNLSRFSRQQNTQPTPVLLPDIVSSVIELRQRRLQEQGIGLERHEAATRRASAVFTELQQVVLNFVINAEQAVMAREAADRRIAIRTFDTARGVQLEVEDSGPGVPLEDETKLFQPFFTTKPVGEGTGLGLSVSYGIIQSLGGSIGYRRSPAGGAVFYFEVPASSEDD